MLVNPDFLQSVNVSVLPRSDNTYDLGSESYRWRNVYAVNIYADGVSVPNKAPIVWDDTQKSVSGTTETEVKNFRFAKSSAVRAWSKLYVLASLWVSGGTGHLKIYVDGETSPRLDLSTTNTSETVLSGEIDISDLGEGIHTLHVKLVNEGSYDTYNELLEVWAS